MQLNIEYRTENVELLRYFRSKFDIPCSAFDILLKNTHALVLALVQACSLNQKLLVQSGTIEPARPARKCHLLFAR